MRARTHEEADEIGRFFTEVAEVIEARRQPWRDRAVCADETHRLSTWFDRWDEDYARKLCAGCPVRIDCLASAAIGEEQHGIWVGMRISEYMLYQTDFAKCVQCSGVIRYPKGNQTLCSDECRKERLRDRDRAKRKRQRAGVIPAE